MQVIEPTVEVMFFKAESGMTPEECIEAAGRTCYQSRHKVEAGSAPKFVEMVRRRGHHAMLEFGYAMVRITADRGLTHELVRHRLASYAQESTRYCNYSKNKFGKEITVIRQPGIPEEHQARWREMMVVHEAHYFELIDLGIKAEHARSVLPIGIKSEIVTGANLREWRHIFKMRCDTAAHPIIRGATLKVFRQFYEKMPSVYADQAETFIPVAAGDVFENRLDGSYYEVEKAGDQDDAWIELYIVRGPKEGEAQVDGFPIRASEIYDRWERIKLGPEVG